MFRKELKELWNSHNQLTEHSAQQAQLIQQLQSLQHDTHISQLIVSSPVPVIPSHICPITSVAVIFACNLCQYACLFVFKFHMIRMFFFVTHLNDEYTFVFGVFVFLN